MCQFAWGALLLWLACASVPAFAQATLTVTVNGLRSAKGNVTAALCGDPGGPFPGPCGAYSTSAPAKEGVTTLIFTGVKAGSYALQLFHDENGNSIPEIPPEGFGYGNDEAFPPDFAKASIRVAGDTATTVSISYLESYGAADGRVVVAVPAGVEKTEVREDGLYGELYIPARSGPAVKRPLPALIVLGGSEGGVETASRIGVAFTGHGYAVLALAYFREAGLPQTLENVPLEYFERALDWLKQQRGIDDGAIGVVGGSRGSEAALLLASRRRDVRAVMVFAPSGMVWQGLNFKNVANAAAAWTAGGKAVPFLIPDAAAYRPNAMRKMFDNALLEANQRPETAIAVEKINGPILLLSGKADALWPSTDLSERLVERLRDRGFEHSVQHLSYEGAGHLVFVADPTSPAARAMAKASPNAMLGGTGPANAAAWADNWPKTLAFFDKALKRTR